MRIHELLSLLEDMDPGDEVRIAYQPSWPLAAHVAGVATAEDEPETPPCARCGGLTEVRDGEAHHLLLRDDEDHEPVPEDDGDDGEPSGLEPGVVWIVAGGAPDHPYAPRAAFAAVERW